MVSQQSGPSGKTETPHRLLACCAQDAAEGKKVLEFLMRYLDGEPGRWLGGPVRCPSAAALRSLASPKRHTPHQFVRVLIELRWRHGAATTARCCRWPQVLEAGMGIMRQACAEEHQRYLLFSSLMRHVAAPGVHARMRLLWRLPCPVGLRWPAADPYALVHCMK